MTIIEPKINALYNSVSYIYEMTNLIDCGDWHNSYIHIKNVLLTHAHLDHIYGLNKLADKCPDIKVYTNIHGRDMLLNPKKNLSFYHETPFEFTHPDTICLVSDGEIVNLADGLTAKAIFTPGHNTSCITWQIGNALFTGDAYIPGIKTVTNLPGGNKAQAVESLALIEQLAANRMVYPGHKI